MLDILYENIGGKIKNWAKRLFVIEAIGGIIAGIALLIDNGFEDGWWALFIMIGGPIVAWVFSWILYAFGQIVDDIHEIRNQNQSTGNTHQNLRTTAQPIGRTEENAKHETEQPQAAPEEGDQKNAPETTDEAPFITTQNNTIICSSCKYEQPSNRKVCWQCGTKFFKNK